MKKIRVVLLILVVSLVVILAAEAQDTPTIAVGETVTGRLSSENRSDTYTFMAQAEDTVTITLESDEFDTYLVLLNSDDEELAADDDSAGNLNSLIEAITLPANGTYTILVDSARHHQNSDVFSEGAYTLRLEEGTPGIATTDTTGTSIQMNDTITGNLTDTSPSEQYVFSGLAGTSVTITLTSDDFDAYLTLLDANGNELAADDDSAGALNARIGPFELPHSGMYTIVVDSARHASNPEQISTGVYSLRVETETGGTTAVYDGETITIGDSINSALNSDYPSREYAFAAQSGDVVMISLTTSDFDGYLVLKDAQGSTMATDDDSGGDLDPRIGPLELAETGTYTIVATSYDYEIDDVVVSGDFHLSVIAPEIAQISYNESAKGQLSDTEPFAFYVFEGEAGDAVIATLDAEGFYGDIQLASTQSPSDVLAATSFYDSYSDTLRLGPIELPKTGSYTITFQDSEFYGTVDYTLSLNRVQVSEITLGEPMTVEIANRNDPVYVSFEGEAGQAVDISADSDGTIDTTLTVYDPYNYEIASDDDSGNQFDPEINRLVLTESGTYHILLEAYEFSESGTVTLLVLPVELPSLDNGPQEIRLDEKRYSDVVTFMGHAGEKVQITIAVIGRAGVASPYVDVAQNGEYVTYADLSDVSKVSIEFVVPDDGVVNVTIKDYSSYYGVTLEISLTRVPNA